MEIQTLPGSLIILLLVIQSMFQHSTPEAHSHFLAMGLDEFLVARGEHELNREEFDYVVDALISFKSDVKRNDFARLLTKFSRDEIVYRTKALTRLTNLLNHLQTIHRRPL